MTNCKKVQRQKIVHEQIIIALSRAVDTLIIHIENPDHPLYNEIKNSIKINIKGTEKLLENDFEITAICLNIIFATCKMNNIKI
ncbi:MAG: hypothetical protein ATN35_01485 [Epulopiscium sp. Nele67-Bin004]|nr:MAG: hypothetical protein ATN35_01485 [Epulopiscium sp. Nele67-Bin004]